MRHLNLLAAAAMSAALALPAVASATTTSPAGGSVTERGPSDATRAHHRAAAARAGGDAVSGKRMIAARDAVRRQLAAAPTVAAATPTTVPTIISPADASTVAGLTTMSAQSTATTVQFTRADFGTTSVAVSSGLASTPLDTFGETDGSHTFEAADCEDTCNTTTASATYTVDNGPVAITSPTDGAQVGGSFVAQATSSGGSLEFLVDGVTAAWVDAAPYLATIATTDLTTGAHVLTVVRCDAAHAHCGDVGAPVSFSVVRVSPVVTSVRPSTFSPNGDGRSDTVTVDYQLDSTQTVSWSVKNSAGATVRGPVKLGSQGAGSHSFVFNGKTNAGRFLTDGGYVVSIDTSKLVGGSTVRGHAEHAVIVDLKAPSQSSIGASPATFFPVRDGFKDTTTITVHTSEPTSRAQLSVFNGSGRKIAGVTAGGSSSLTRQLIWNGRASSGAVVPAGSYTYTVTLVDLVANQSTSGKHGIVVSGKKLVKQIGSRTLSPFKDRSDTLIGYCSEVVHPARSGAAWSGSLGYLADYDVCYDPAGEDTVAYTQYRLSLPSATKYGSVRVRAYGGRDLPGYADIGFILYEDRYGDISSQGGVLGAADGWHSASSVALDSYRQGRSFRWWAGTGDNYYYDIRSLEVSYTYYLLK